MAWWGPITYRLSRYGLLSMYRIVVTRSATNKQKTRSDCSWILNGLLEALRTWRKKITTRAYLEHTTLGIRTPCPASLKMLGTFYFHFLNICVIIPLSRNRCVSSQWGSNTRNIPATGSTLTWFLELESYSGGLWEIRKITDNWITTSLRQQTRRYERMCNNQVTQYDASRIYNETKEPKMYPCIWTVAQESINPLLATMTEAPLRPLCSWRGACFHARMIKCLEFFGTSARRI
jgi:hypothetical protein